MSCTNNFGTSSFKGYHVKQTTSCSGNVADTKCIVYTGPYLSCINVQTNTCLQDIIQSIDSKVCQSVGNYIQYNFNCLSEIYTITNESEFVNAITDYACNLKSQVNTLTQVVNDNYTALEQQIQNIVNPNLISACPSLVAYNTTSNLYQIIGAQTNALCDIYGKLNLSSVNWSSCYTPTTIPTTIVEGFNEVISQICLTKASGGSGGGVLPTFDNTGTCLSSPTAADSLYDTVIKIRTRLCSTPTFSASNLNSSSCVSFTTSSTLENVINSQNALLDSLSGNSIKEVSSDFSLTPIDPLDPCSGKRLTLSAIVADRNVALNSSDVTPGTLADKIQAGSNITLDFGTTTPGKLIISASGGSASDEKVKINSSDPTAGFLEDKIIGSINPGITLEVVQSGNQLEIGAILNFSEIAAAILDAIEEDDLLRARLCTINEACKPACTPPANASVTFQTT